MNHWLFKSEPDTFSIDHLILLPKQTSGWDGVRNYQARNFMRDSMRIGDLGFFYHSNCPIPGVVGIVRVASQSYADPTAFDKRSKYYDPKSSCDNPRWFMVDVRLVEKFTQIVPLQLLRTQNTLKDMQLLRPGNRLSISPVSAHEWKIILKMAINK